MNYRQRQARTELVRQYLDTIRNRTQRDVCCLLMGGVDEGEICRRLRIGREKLDCVKSQIATEMRNFGLAPEDWEEKKNA